MEPIELETFVRRAQAGDFDACSEVVEAYQQDVLATIAFRVPDRSLVEEIAQQTFIFAFEHLRDYTPGTDFAAWLRAIAHQRVRAELKTLARRSARLANYRERLRQSLLAEASAEPAAEEADPGVLERMRRCLTKLPDPWKVLIESHYFSRKPVKAIAADLGRTVTWVTTSMMRARRAIRSCLKSAAPEATA
jgi:RNA polymerase sigma-70 factor (ECF subfamily)